MNNGFLVGCWVIISSNGRNKGIICMRCLMIRNKFWNVLIDGRVRWRAHKVTKVCMFGCFSSECSKGWLIWCVRLVVLKRWLCISIIVVRWGRLVNDVLIKLWGLRGNIRFNNSWFRVRFGVIGEVKDKWWLGLINIQTLVRNSVCFVGWCIREGSLIKRVVLRYENGSFYKVKKYPLMLVGYPRKIHLVDRGSSFSRFQVKVVA